MTTVWFVRVGDRKVSWFDVVCDVLCDDSNPIMQQWISKLNRIHPVAIPPVF